MEIDLEHPLRTDGKLDNVSGRSTFVLTEKEDLNYSGNSARDEVQNIVMRDQVLQGGGNWGNINEPRCGLEFESKEAAYSFYREYARLVGFGITIKASRRSKKSGKFIDVKISCSRFGNERTTSATSNLRSCPKTDCKASMHIKKRNDGVWFIYSFVKDHNHEIFPDDFCLAIRGRKKQSVAISGQKKGLQLSLDEEDVHVLFEHFMTSQAENPNFLYALDLDQEKRLRNVFWVDAKGRNDYKYFSDVVFFDMNYVRQKYKIPFVPIFGVNHHFQFILFGCALIGDETTSSFLWLMRTWLRAMNGQAPIVVITDDDKALKNTISAVFPKTRHCFCLWHVLRKIPEILGHTVTRFENFSTKFKKCALQCWTDEEFENRWWKLVGKFELRENEWIQSLYEDREKWVPTYMRDVSLAGLSTAERCDSISSFFDKHINTKSTFKEFIDQYKVFLNERSVEEAKADFETLKKQPIVRTLSPFEKQMSTVYTHAIFKIFQVEVLETDSCSIQKQNQGETIITFLVDDFEGTRNFYVSWNEAESSIYCSCRSFEYRGFLCRHALLVLQLSGISNIPSHYVLKRWTKDAKINQILDRNNKRPRFRVERFNDLCKLAAKLGEEGAVSQESYNIALCAVEEALKHCVDVNNSVGIPSESYMLNQELIRVNKECNIGKGSKRKKTPEKQKVCTETELMAIRRQVANQQREVLDERAGSDTSYVPQQGMQGMALRSGNPYLDCYVNVPQTAEGEEPMNLMPSMQDGCYTTQQGMHGLLITIPSRVGQFSPHQTLHALGQVSFNAPTVHGHFGFQDSLHDIEETVDNASKHLQDNHIPR
ncbi:protein FAR1-RELATED SEQUENCE 2-like isoform X2 [Apium graveolens]|uniref:protein FAR1-RELATED SEQUENCE 2-like isoform X2 n=1 Tax=Apium graveolens TaxID=4045 RepID=UPI003D7AA257